MQPVRVIIAAIFFVIGALIVIPAFTGRNTDSNASGTPSASPATTSPTATATSPSAGRSPSRSASASPSPSRTSASPKPSATSTSPRPSASTTSPRTPVPTTTPRAPSAVPLTISFTKVACPARRVSVRVTNEGEVTQGYSIVRDGSIFLADQLGPNATRTSELTLREDKATTVRITQNNQVKASKVLKANCVKNSATPKAADDDDDTPPPSRLPNTGSDDVVMFARIATGVGAMLTGAIILWWGGLWPRRRSDMFSR